MIQRCYNQTQVSYPEYGGRGIQVDSEWLGNEGLRTFIEDMSPSFEIGLTLERVNSNGNYCKANCKWANWSEQTFNRRRPRNNTTGKTGVSFRSHKKSRNWTAYIYKEGKRIALGDYETFEEAKAAREAAEIELFGFIKE